MAIRAFATHPVWRRKHEVLAAGAALKECFFKPDAFNERRPKSYWFKLKFPFWWSNLLTALDSLSWIGFSARDREISAALSWFRENQAEDSLWPTGYSAGRKARSNQCWVGLAVCRMLKRSSDG
jgi:hypothetical protein